MNLVILIQLLLASLVLCTKKAAIFCDAAYGKYTANSGNIILTTVEFPIMSTIPPGSAGLSDLSIPKLLHPCYSLSTNNNYKNLLYDIFTYGNFVQTVCQRKCAHFVDALRITCGDRRPPPTWQVGSVGTTNRKINCSNWDLPLTDKGTTDGINLIYTYGTYSYSTGVDFNPPYTMDNKSLAYLDKIIINGLHIKPVVDTTKKTEALADMEHLLDQFAIRHPEITHVTFGNPTAYIDDSAKPGNKKMAVRFKPTDKFYDTLTKLPNLNSLSLSFINIGGKETINEGMTKNLKSIGFYNVTMSAVPNWLATASLQFLEFQSSLTDDTDISVLNELPELEHFLITESSISSIKSNFLVKSVSLISLTLQCNAISVIAKGAFDHFTELRFLNLAGNRLISLPQNLFMNLNNLVTLDLKAIDNNTTTIQTFNEVTMQCQRNLNPDEGYYLKSAMPKVANPEKLLVLDIRGQSKFLKQNKTRFNDFKNLEVLNIGNLGLSTIKNLSLESLCNLNDLNLLGNPLDEQDWISEEIFLNLNLDRLRLGEPQSMTSVPHSLVAFMRTSSQVMYSSTLSLNQVHTYKYKIGCVYDTISSATMFGYRLQNGSCEEEVDMAIEKIRDLEIKKMESNCE